MTLLDAPYIFQIGGIAAAVTLILSLPGIWIARRVGLIDWPGQAAHKKHERPMPLAGGIIIASSVLVISPFLGLWSTPALRGIMIAALIVMVFGAWDDRKILPAWVKLAGQLAAGIIVIATGTSVHFVTRLAPPGISLAISQWGDWAITLFWLVGITNAFNFIDSMDGLVVGISGVALSFFLLATFDAQQTTLVKFSTLLLGICVGLYFYNIAPASLFLGDSGAQMLGFCLACIGVLYNPPNYPQGSSWFVPIMLLGVPIFDTMLVVFSRLQRRWPIYKADYLHTYHRLVALGLETKKSVVVMHLAGIFLGCLAFVTLSLPPWAANLSFGFSLLVGLGLMIFLNRKSEPKQDSPEIPSGPLPFSFGCSWKPRYGSCEMNPDSMKEFSPLTAMENALRNWWLLIAVTILGGGAGWTFHLLQPPFYEAKAIITMSIDFTQAGPMSQYEEDYTFYTAGAWMTSTVTREQMVARAQEQGMEITVEQLNGMMFLESKQSVWELRIRHSDPQIAAALANIWAEEAYAALERGRGHAWQEWLLFQELVALQRCLPQSLSPTPIPTLTNYQVARPSPFDVPRDEVLCASFNSIEQIQAAKQVVVSQLSREKEAAGGVLPFLTFALTERASPPSQPVVYQRNTLVLGGAFVGFIAGIWVVNLPLVRRRLGAKVDA